MNSIIENLNKKIGEMGLNVIDERMDPEYDFTYCIAVRTEKSIFVIYTTRGYFYLYGDSCLRLFEVAEHLPFDSVEPWEGSEFVLPYTRALMNTGKCVMNHDRCYALEDITHFLEA